MAMPTPTGVGRRRRSVTSPSSVLVDAQAGFLAARDVSSPDLHRRRVHERGDHGKDHRPEAGPPKEEHPGSLELDLRARLSSIEQKLDLLTVCLSANFDKVNFEISRTRGESSRHHSKVPPSLSPLPVQQDSQEPSDGFQLTPTADSMAVSPRSPDAEQQPPLDGEDLVSPTVDRNKSNKSHAERVEEAVRSAGFNFGSRSGPLARAIWEILEDPESSSFARMYGKLEGLLIMVSVIGSLLKTMDPPPVEVRTILTCLLCLDAYFLLELLLRYTVCHSTWLFLSNASNMIDMTAGALSFGLNTPCLHGAWQCTGDGTVAMTLIVVMPMLRLMKSLRHFHQFDIFVRFAFDISEALVVLLLLLSMIVLMFASIVYLVEPRENIPTMPLAMYFIVTTVSTVGYGDYSPESTIGHIVVSVVILVSIMFMALPLGIIGNSFAQIWSQRDHVLLSRRIKDRLKQWGYTAGDMDALIADFDADTDGQLELHEFVGMIEEMGISANDEKVVALFESFDIDAREAVNAKNLTRVLFPGKYHELYPTSTKKRVNPFAAMRIYGANPRRQDSVAGLSFTNLFRAKDSAVIPHEEVSSEQASGEQNSSEQNSDGDGDRECSQ